MPGSVRPGPTRSSGPTKAAVIGLGSITPGVLAALSSSPDVAEIVATRRRAAPREALGPRVTVLAQDSLPGANTEAVRGAGVVVLCVKPHQVRDVLAEVRDVLGPGVMLISVAAGFGFDTLRRAVGPGPQLARLLPNTAAGVGQGVVGLLLEDPDDAWRSRLTSWFEQVGMVVSLPSEDAVDALSAVAGSGPAYVFRFLEAMTEAATDLGFDAEEAAAVCRQVVVGAAALLTRTPDLDAAALRRAVTSPGGTTEQAMTVIDESAPQTVMSQAFRAALDHAARLDSAG